MKPTPRPAPSELSKPDTHPFIAKRKASLLKKFSWGRMETLFQTSDLAWYLVALDRPGDAYRLATEVADGLTFDGNYDTWTGATVCLALAARLARFAGKSEIRDSLVRRIVAHPSHTLQDRESFERWTAKYRGELDRAQKSTSGTSACTTAARTLADSCYIRETAGFGFNYDHWIDTPRLESVMSEALTIIRTRLPRRPD